MTHFLVTTENPKGWRLEDILSEIQKDIFRRCTKILDDPNPVAAHVRFNNIKILDRLTECIHLAEDSTRELDSIGPSQSGKGGKPRIGVA